MTVGDDQAAEIRRLYYAEHWKRGTIAAQLAVHPDVVKRVIGPLGPAPGTPRPPATLLDAYRGFIDATLEQYPTLVATRLFDMLVARGYKGSLRTLRRYVRKVRPRKRKAYLDLETLPGEVGQVDWAHVGEIAVAGGHRPLWLFVMVLAYSRAIFAELVLSLDASSLRRSLLRSAHYLGGNPRAWLFDNAKTVVAPELRIYPRRRRVRPPLGPGVARVWATEWGGLLRVVPAPRTYTTLRVDFA